MFNAPIEELISFSSYAPKFSEKGGFHRKVVEHSFAPESSSMATKVSNNTKLGQGVILLSI